MKHFGINSAPHRRMSGRSFLLALPLPFLSFFLYLSSSPSSSPFSFFAFSRRHLPPSAHLQGTNIWETQFEHFSTTKKRQTMLEKRGDKHAPSWCWTNMSRSLQFTNGPATFSTHRCGNSRTNLIAPMAAVVVSGFVCLSCFSLYYCLTDLLLEGCGPLKWQEKDGMLLKDKNKGISLHHLRLSLEDEINTGPSWWSSSFINIFWPERATRTG